MVKRLLFIPPALMLAAVLTLAQGGQKDNSASSKTVVITSKIKILSPIKVRLSLPPRGQNGKSVPVTDAFNFSGWTAEVSVERTLDKSEKARLYVEQFSNGKWIPAKEFQVFVGPISIPVDGNEPALSYHLTPPTGMISLASSAKLRTDVTKTQGFTAVFKKPEVNETRTLKAVIREFNTETYEPTDCANLPVNGVVSSAVTASPVDKKKKTVKFSFEFKKESSGVTYFIYYVWEDANGVGTPRGDNVNVITFSP